MTAQPTAQPDPGIQARIVDLRESELQFNREKLALYAKQSEQDVALYQITARYVFWGTLFRSVLLAVVLVIAIVLLYQWGTEDFVPYASILAPNIINSTSGFDLPNQYGEDPDPYRKIKKESEDRLWGQTMQSSLR